MSILILHKKNLSRRRHLDRTRRYAREHGERVLLIMKDPTWEAEYVDRVAVADTTSIEDTVAAAKELAAAEAEPITAVVTFAEACVPAVARLAADLGLPGTAERTAHIARDKYAMREALAGAPGVAQPGYGLARTLDEARELAGRLGYPLVLKPVIGTGSMYVRSVDDDAQLAEFFAPIQRGCWDGFSYDPLHDEALNRYGEAVLIEQFVGGPEISVESLVVDGVTHAIAIHDKPLPTGPTFEEVYACTPTRLPADTAARLYAAARAVHEAMGITTGATHVEFRLRDGVEPVLLEAAARLGGGPIYRSVQLSTGVDMVEAMLDLAAGRTPSIVPRATPRWVGFRNIFPDAAGTLVAIGGVAEARTNPAVDEIEIYRAVGDHLDVPPRTFQGHGHVIFATDSAAHLDAVFDHLVRTVRLETSPSSNGGRQ
ncbi:MAG TPA: ATP-grasp domain-containing protein [Rugosimonospora sp.]|nr:ATP-grasp domain-containing protein [Rugosimonospora sp.]